MCSRERLAGDFWRVQSSCRMLLTYDRRHVTQYYRLVQAIYQTHTIVPHGGVPKRFGTGDKRYLCGKHEVALNKASRGVNGECFCKLISSLLLRSGILASVNTVRCISHPPQRQSRVCCKTRLPTSPSDSRLISSLYL